VLDALLPAYQAVVLADFINCAAAVFEGTKSYADVVRPILIIVCYILFMNLMPSIASTVSLTGKNTLTMKIKDLMITKRAVLEYRHIENPETQELINRVCFDPVENFTSGFNNLLSMAKIVISSASLLFIIMQSTLISGIIIVTISIPLFMLAARTGKRNYEMSKDSKKNTEKIQLPKKSANRSRICE
jgi:ATP-binding cassette subfamily B protein